MMTLSFVVGTTQSHVVAINCAASPLCRQFLVGLGSALIANTMRNPHHHSAPSMQIERGSLYL